MASLPQRLHPCCHCYCATAHRATPGCTALCCCLCCQCQRCPLIHVHRMMLVPLSSSPYRSPAPPSSSSPHNPPIVAWEGAKTYPRSLLRWMEEDAVRPVTVGKKSVPAMPSLFIIATSQVVDDNINKSARRGCGGSGRGRGGGRKGVDNIA
jgi:hypothetical protein